MPLKRTTVPVLLRSCLPAAVLGIVPEIIVNTPQGQTYRTFSHVRQEVLKLQPALIDSYATFSVITGILTGLNSSSVNHSCPRLVGLCAGISMGSVYSQFSSNLPAFASKATTTLSSSRFEVRRTCGYFTATVTKTSPHRLSPVYSCKSNDGKAIELESHQTVSHDWEYNT